MPAAEVIQLHPSDNVAVAVSNFPAGHNLRVGGDRSICLREPIGAGHKFATEVITTSQPIRKFGQTIGFATKDIAIGDWVHVHNVSPGQLNLQFASCSAIPPEPAPVPLRYFQGYRRPDGRAATRNYIGVISTVNCSATASKYVAQHFPAELLDEFPRVDGIAPLLHKAGCAIQYDGEDHRLLTRTLSGFARHPNMAAYVVIGLGCETAQTSFLMDRGGLVQLNVSDSSLPATQPLVLNIQEQGGVARTVKYAVDAIRELLPEVNKTHRVPIPVSEIKLGLECGGSDGYSGITANPALGYASDLLVAHGGTSILSETPEIYGGEHLLTARAVTPAVAERLLERVRWWERYVARFGGTIDNNPSVGNKKGGLTTIYEKSLGAIAKGGTSALRAVYEYGETVTDRGFVFMDTPGYDPMSVTGLVAGGANVVVFTTGRGSCFGCKPVPTLKVTSNSDLYHRMKDDMDFDAGRILTGSTLEQVGIEMFERIVEVASGTKTKSEEQGIGDEEFCPWTYGPVL